MEQDWFESKELSESSLKNFEELSKQAFSLRKEIANDQSLVDEKKKNLADLQLKMQALLEEAGLKSFKSSEGTIFIRESAYFKVPVETEKREAFFNYLKEKGAFDSLITVNYNTLNSYCKQEFEIAMKNGDVNFTIPGLDSPSLLREIRMRKGD